MSATFKDNKEKEWTIKLDTPLVKRITELRGVKLTDLNSEPFSRLGLDPILLIDVLYLACEKEAKAASVSDVEFGERVDPTCVDAATEALLNAVTELYPSSKRAHLKALHQKNQEMQSNALGKTVSDINGANQQAIEAEMSKRAAERLKKFLSGDVD